MRIQCQSCFHRLRWPLAMLLTLTCAAAGAEDPRPAKNRPARPPDQLQVGSTAPDFKLKSPDGKQTVELSSFRGRRPVALIFGSYT